MLRPATPLTVVLFCAFILLLISSLSSPVIKNVPLARWENYNFGVLGFCDQNGKCSSPKVGYNTVNLLGTSDNPSFNLPSSARHSLSSLLIVHPIAAFLTLVMLALAAAAHFHSPSHSPRYLLALLILTLPTLLITLLAFLVDILLFIPHLAWGGWICLAATILIVISGICLCAMRRTLVSRKARRKRIQENAEMSGENFYNRQREQDVKFSSATPVSESKAPLVNGAPGADHLPTHATYAEFQAEQAQRQNHEPVSPISDENRYYGASTSGPTPNSSRMGPSEQQPRSDGFPPDNSYPPQSYGQPRGGGPYRGRGAPRPYGRGGPRGGGPYRGPPPGFQGRGGYGPDARDNYRGRGGPPMPSGAVGGSMARRPPPGYPQPQGGPYATQYSQPINGYSQPSSPSDYGPPIPMGALQQSRVPQRQLSSNHSDPLNTHRRSSDGTDGLARAETPPDMIPIGQAVDMDTNTGYANGVHQQPRAFDNGQPQYVPARSDWNHQDAGQPTRQRGTSVTSHGSSKYYEDVPDRFAEGETPSAPPQNHITSALPQSSRRPVNIPDYKPNPPAEPFEEIPAGARSPATSEQSAWTSVSQRPVNPDWKPGHGGEFNQFGPHRKPVQNQTRQDMILSNNPDFSVTGMGPPRGNSRARGSYRGNISTPLPPSGMEMGGDGRYPEPAVLTTREI